MPLAKPLDDLSDAHIADEREEENERRVLAARVVRDSLAADAALLHVFGFSSAGACGVSGAATGIGGFLS